MAQSDLADKEMRDIPMFYRLISMVRGKVLWKTQWIRKKDMLEKN